MDEVRTVSAVAMSAADFVEAVKTALGATSNADLAAKLGLPHASVPQVGRWLRGENEPDYATTMLMLEKCGWLKMTGRRPKVVPAPGDPLAEVAKGVAALQQGQGEVLAIVQRLAGVGPSPRQVEPTENPGRGRR